MLEEELSQRVGADPQCALTASSSGGSSHDTLASALKEGLSLDEEEEEGDRQYLYSPATAPADPSHLSTPKLLGRLRTAHQEVHAVLAVLGINNDKLLPPDVSATPTEQSAACTHGGVVPTTPFCRDQ